MKGKVAKDKGKKDIIKGQREPFPKETFEAVENPNRTFDFLPQKLLPKWPTDKDLEVYASLGARFQNYNS
jgi:hypothetical protein